MMKRDLGMEQAEFMDKLFDVLNEADDCLSIQDIATDARLNIVKVYLTDGSVFQIQCVNTGYWWLFCG